MSSRNCDPQPFLWYALPWCISVVALVFQLFPSLWSSIWSGLFWAGNISMWAGDFRNWTRQTWLWVLTTVCTVCVVIRFGPELVQAWRERSVARVQRRAHVEHARQLREAREKRERIEESRRRRIY